MSLQKNKWVQGFESEIEMQPDGEIKHYLRVRSYTPLHKSEAKFDRAAFDALIQHTVEFLKENPGFDGARFTYVEPKGGQ